MTETSDQVSGFVRQQKCSDCDQLHPADDLVAVSEPPNGIVCEACKARRVEIFGAAWRRTQPRPGA